MQVVFASVQFLEHSVCSIHSQWCSVLAGLQSTAFMVCPYYYPVSVVFSLVFSCHWVGFRVYYRVQCQFSVCSVQGVYCLVGHSPSVLFSVCSVQEHWLFTKSLSCPCHVQSPHFECPLPLRSSWILTSRHCMTTEGHLRTKYNVNIIFKSTYHCTMTHILVQIYCR